MGEEGVSHVAWKHWFEVHRTLYYYSAGSNQPTMTYGGGLEEKLLSRGRCIYVVGATRSFMWLRPCNGRSVWGDVM